MPSLRPCLVLSGPTAVGKTSILDLLACHSPWPLEVISADAFQVYRGLDKGTAKPGIEQRQRIPHHLIDIRNLDEAYSVGDFVRDATMLIRDIRQRGNLPVVCGGTVFYVKHLLAGAPETPLSNPAIRQSLQADWSNGHAQDLRQELARVDPESAGRIHSNDSYRILRALEVWRSTGRPLSAYQTTGAKSEACGLEPAVFIALERPRLDLVARIQERVAQMFTAGLATEVETLAKLGHSPAEPGLKAIGYQEFFVEVSAGSWELLHDHAIIQEQIAIHTRQYAKRQMTFLRGLPGVNWISAIDPAQAVQEIRERLADCET